LTEVSWNPAPALYREHSFCRFSISANFSVHSRTMTVIEPPLGAGA
jgi:hypothetical protein